MFTVSETEAATIRTTMDRDGELSAAIELRRLFGRLTADCRRRTASGLRGKGRTIRA